MYVNTISAMSINPLMVSNMEFDLNIELNINAIVSASRMMITVNTVHRKLRLRLGE